MSEEQKPASEWLIHYDAGFQAARDLIKITGNLEAKLIAILAKAISRNKYGTEPEAAAFLDGFMTWFGFKKKQ